MWSGHDYEKQGLYSLSGKTSYRQISWSFVTAILNVIMFISLCNLTDISAAVLPRCLSNCRAIGKVCTRISRLRSKARSYSKTSIPLVKRGPGNSIFHSRQRRNIKALYYWSFVIGIHRWIVDSTHRGPVTWRAFQCHDINILRRKPLSVTGNNVYPEIRACIFSVTAATDITETLTVVSNSNPMHHHTMSNLFLRLMIRSIDQRMTVHLNNALHAWVRLG